MRSTRESEKHLGGYTILNLEELEDVAPSFGMDGLLEARFARDALGLERSGLGFERLAPGARLPFGHRHREQEEVYVVVAGGGRVALDDETLELKTLDAVRVPPETMRCFEAGPEGLSLIVFGAPSTGPGDSEITPGWWSRE